MLYIRELSDVLTGMETNVGVWANVVIIINRTKVVIIFQIAQFFAEKSLPNYAYSTRMCGGKPCRYIACC